MHDDHTSSHLRSLLQRPPSTDVWYALDALLDPLDSPPAALIDYASAHLSRWPSHLRRDASDDVFDWLEDRRPSWALSLLNAAMITTAEHLRRLPLAPFAAHIAHLQIDIHKQLNQRQLTDALHRLPALESITFDLTHAALKAPRAIQDDPETRTLSGETTPTATHITSIQKSHQNE